jgi:hypothetical protein
LSPPFFLPLFTNLLEVVFCELRLYSILGSPHSPGPMRYASPGEARGGAHLPHNAHLRGPTSAAIVSLLARGNELHWFINFTSLY